MPKSGLFILSLLLPCVLSAAPGDVDNDGLRDAVETQNGVFVSAENTGSNPNLADTDGDSLPDGMEVSLGTNPNSAASKVKRPNIIYIVADDLGYGDLGCFWQNQRTASMKFTTPGLDAMAAEGAMLTHHYVGASICASSRCSFLQGRSMGHGEARDFEFDKPISAKYNLASVLKSAGYRTVHIGKAGLAGKDSRNPSAHPLIRGFNRFFGYLTHTEAHEHYPRNGNTEKAAMICDDYQFINNAHQDLYTSDVFTAFAKKEIIEQTSQRPDQPFFIYLAYDTPHFLGQYAPTANYPAGSGTSGGLQWTGAPSYVNTAINDPNRVNNPANRHPSVPSNWDNNSKYFVSMVRRMDDSVADILQTLRDLDIDQDTLVVFTADNGPDHNTVNLPNFESYGPLAGSKGDLLEGGIRVPTIAWWPGKIAGTNQPSNIRKISRPCVNYDWLATFSELAKTPIPSFTDGTSLAPTLTGEGTQMDRGFLYFELYNFGNTAWYPDFGTHAGGLRNNMQAIRMGDFMGLRTNIINANDSFRIYNVVSDPRQTVNLAPGQPELQQEMQRLAIGSRRSIPSVWRPYQDTQIPAKQPVNPVRSGLKWKSFEGYWPWLPEFRSLTPSASGESFTIQTNVRSRNNDFGLSFEGYLSITTPGSYTFQITSDSGAALWVHEVHAIDNDVDYASSKNSSPVLLTAGLHPIRLFYRHQSGPINLDLKYSGPGLTMQQIPASAFFVDGQPTVLLPDTANTAKETPVTMDVLANDTAQNPLQLQSLSPPNNGGVTILNNKVVYTPAGGFIGTDQFTYSVYDGVRAVNSNAKLNVLFDDEIWIPLDDGNGTAVTVHGAGVPAQGTLAGAVNPSGSWVSGRLGRALLFDGADARVEFPSLPLPTGSAPRTFSCWLKTDNTSLGESQTLFSYGQGSGAQRFTIRLDRGPSSPDALVAAVEALPGRIAGSTVLNDGAWHHLIVVLADADQNGSTDISEVKLYVDGQPDLPSAVSSGIPATAAGSAPILGGRDDTSVGNFKGRLDDVRIFSRALTPVTAGTLHQTLLANAVSDSDGDGFADLEEAVAGTDPEDASSLPKLEAAISPDGKVTLQWAGVAERTYLIEESTNLGGWMPVEGLAPFSFTAAMPNASVNLPSNGDPQRFFRLKISLTPPPGPDQDLDGFPDDTEIMAGTNPNDRSSFFRIESMTMAGGGGVSLHWSGKAGRRYRVEESENLFQWMRVPNLPAVDAAVPMPNASILVPANGAPKRFLRMQVELTPP